MYRTRALLSKAGKSVPAEVSEVTKNAAKAAANSASLRGGKTPQTQAPYPYILLRHHKNPSLLPPRNPGSLAYTFHNITSAASAFAAFLTSQSCRDRFVFLTGNAPSSDAEENENDNIHNGNDSIMINTSVLGQSDMGILKALALYQDLSSPLYEQSRFNIQEFMHGCGWALMHFHRNKESFLTKVIHGWKDEFNHPDNKNENEVRHELNYNFSFLDAAATEKNFLSMITPEMMESIKMEGITRMILGNMVGRNDLDMPPLESRGVQPDKRRLGKDADTQVKNVALLSARVEEIYPPPHDDIQTINIDPNVPLEDVFLTPHRNLRDKEPTAQVVAQLEVLYELQQSSLDDDKNTHDKTLMMVAKFEACLDGDPNDTSELQWRLCSYRPAAEFGYFNSW